VAFHIRNGEANSYPVEAGIRGGTLEFVRVELTHRFSEFKSVDILDLRGLRVRGVR
jgi:hypothetical protein